MKRNEALYNARLSLGLSRKEAAKKLQTWSFILKDYEEGYRYLKDDKAKKFALAYGLEESAFLIDDQGYFEALDYEKGKEVKELFPRVRNAFASLPARIINLVLMVICVVICVVGGINYNSVLNHRERYFPDTYNEIYSSIAAEGNVGEFCIMTCIVDTQEAYFHREIDEDGGIFTVKVPIEMDHIGLISFSYQAPDSDMVLHFDAYSMGRCAVSNENSLTPMAEYSMYDPVTRELSENALSEEVRKRIVESLAATKERANIYLASYGAAIDELYLSISRINNDLLIMKNVWISVLFVGGFLAAIALLALIYGIVRQGKLKKEGLYSKVENFVQEEGSEEVVNSRELPRSFDPAPFVCKEDYLRHIFLAIFFIGSLSAMFTKMEDSLSWVNRDFIQSINTVLSYFSGIGTFMVFFLKLQAIISRRNTFLSFLTCFGISSLFYIGEVFVSLILMNYGTFGTLISYALPSNLFTGLAALALFAFFLLNEPKDGKKWQKALFHLGALVPLLYLIAGFVILESRKGISPFLNAALNGGLFEVCIVGVVYIFFIFLFRKISFHRYGREGGEKFMTSSIYTLSRNILLATMVVLLVVLHYVLPYELSLWTLEKNGYFLILVPVFLLYRTRVPKSTKKGELLFDGGYLVLLGLSYVLTWIVTFFK